MTRRVGVERIEKVILKELAKQDGPHGGIGVWLIAPDIVKLLLRELSKERARVRRIVKAQPVIRDPWIDRNKLLAALSGRKGTRG